MTNAIPPLTDDQAAAQQAGVVRQQCAATVAALEERVAELETAAREAAGLLETLARREPAQRRICTAMATQLRAIVGEEAGRE